MMAAKPKRPCARPGCPELVVKGYCKAHRPPPRAGSTERGYGFKWQQASKGFLRRHSTCKRCDGLASVVDHIVPHKGNMKLFWDRKNWQPLCKQCHDRKTMNEDQPPRVGG